MSGDLSVGRALRDSIAQGRLLGPRFTMSGHLLDGPKPIWPGSVAIATAEQARAAVDSVKQAGADFIKVYDLLPRAAFFAIADEAKRQGIPFVGHVPVTVSALEASDAGQRSIEHLTGLLLACSDSEQVLRQSYLPSMSASVLVRAAASLDSAKARVLFRRFVTNQTWQVPTLVVLRVASLLTDSSFTHDSRLKYLSPAIRRYWGATAESQRRNTSTAQMRERQTLFENRLKLVRAMHRDGVRILAGTDTPNLFVIPGFSVHDELGLLVQAGFTPLEALQAATRDAAEFLGELPDVGTVEQGKRADLVLLDANPLDDIKNTERIAAVVLGGKYVSKSDIEGMLARLEATNR